MPDLTSELDDLLATFSEADRPAMREMLTRNPNAVTTLASQKTVYDAFIGGDPVKIAAAQAAAAAVPPATTPTTTTPAGQSVSLGLDQISAMLDGRLKNVYASPEFTAAVDALAEKKAKTMVDSERANIIGRSAELSDTISAIRESHLREFNEPMDSAAFKTFFQTEGQKYGNDLQGSYNAYVSEKRTAKKIADGIAAGLAAQATNATPGTSVPTVNNPQAPDFVTHNMRVISPAGTATPAADVDKAAQAFASMQQGWTQ